MTLISHMSKQATQKRKNICARYVSGRGYAIRSACSVHLDLTQCTGTYVEVSLVMGIPGGITALVIDDPKLCYLMGHRIIIPGSTRIGNY